MADRVLVWHIPKVLSNKVEGANASTEYVLDDDYVPVKVRLSQKVAQAGDPNIVDINDDGVSIFGSVKPNINQGLLESEWETFLSTLTYMEKGSIITLDVDQISKTTPGEKLTVSLEMEKA